ncbi:MAG: thioredoxin [Spirosoma sp.]|nr:thioredoxin [Spirosoma sp.]
MTFLFLWLGLCLNVLNVTQLRSETLPVDEPVGIRFFSGSWQEALAEAKRQNKPIFVDVNASWCPPCRRMVREAFPDAKVGEKYNTRFINYQVDGEKGEGIEIVRSYAVGSYPTLLYIAPNGDLMQRSVGYGGISGLLIQADMALAIPKMRRYLAKAAKAAKATADSLRREADQQR